MADTPVTREEQYLAAIAGEGNVVPDEPITRVEQYLAAILENGGGGGGGGGGDVTSYNALTNKPKINGVTLTGDKSTKDLNIEALPAGGTAGQVLKKKSAADNDVEWGDSVTDTALSTTSTNPVQNKVVRAAIGDVTALTTTVKSNVVSAVNELDADIGDPGTLTTAEKRVVVKAINELDKDLGNPADLTTTERTEVVKAVNELDGEIGNLSSLNTTAKNTVVAAINEVDGEVGILTNLTTTAKNNLVLAVNELDADVGTPADLTTTAKDNVVAAINEHDAEIGVLAALTTAAKNTLVAAVNEVDGDIGNLANLRTSSRTTVVTAINELNNRVVPKGGTAGYILAKKSNDNNDVEWIEPAEGSTIDTSLSATSENAVQNKAIYATTGNKENLKTDTKTNLVAAVNELNDEIGDLNHLTTSHKNTVVHAINEHDTEIGDVSTLKTEAKTSLVAGLNELHDNVLEKDNTVSFTPTTDYHPATKKYIDDIDKLIEGNFATVESSTKASKAYAAGDYLVYNHKLYCVKTAIAINGTITVTGTNANVTVKRVDEVIAELNAKDAAQEAEIAALATTGGVKNIVPNEGADTFTQAGITFTKNADGSVTANGTATSTAIYRMKENLTLPKGKYVISGSPSGAADDKFFIQLHKQGVVTHRDTNNPIYPQEWDETGETVYDWYGVAFLNGTVADNMTFYPMIRPQGTSADYVKGMNPNPVLATQALADAIAGAGAKNKLKLTGLAQETKYGITCTINTDGTVTVDGTATADSYFFIVTNTKDAAWNFGNDYIMTGCPSGGSADTYGLAYRVGRDSDDQMVRIDWDYGSGVVLGGFNATSQRVRVMVFVKSGQTVSNLVFSPMVRLAAITDDTYVPYGMDNASLTDVAEVVMDDKNISGRYSGDTYTRVGVTFTLNDDGSVTATGTATAHSYYNCNIGFKLKAGRTYRISSGLAANTNGTSMQIIVNGSAAADTLTLGYAIYTPTQDVEATVCVVVRNGNTVNNLKIYPMLMDDRIPDKSYTPPVMSLAEITATLSDTGWITLKTGIRYRKKNGVVTVVVALDTTDMPTLAGGSWQNLNSDAPIPTTARPTIVYPAVAHARKVTGKENDFFQAQVNTGGAIQILVPNSMTINSTNYNMLRLEVSFPV